MTFTFQPASVRGGSFRHRHDVLLYVSGAVIVLLVIVAVLAPWIAPYDPEAGDILTGFAPPSAEHWLGTDSAGRDMLSRLIAGSQSSLLGAALVTVIAGILGSGLAVVMAWKGGWFDSGMMAALAVLFAFPGAIMAILAATLFGPSLWTAIVTTAIPMTPAIARVVRSETLRQRSMPYISTAWLQGLSGWRVSTRHLLPNVAPIIVAQLATIFGYAMLGIATLSFLGLGIRPPAADWGVMISDGKASVLQGHPAESLWAGIMIIIAVMAFTVFADALTARFGRRSQ